MQYLQKKKKNTPTRRAFTNTRKIAGLRKVK